ncbi:MAG: GC-type dockerin domain-anchored protein, partial [Planctomycetota bacterium]
DQNLTADAEEIYPLTAGDYLIIVDGTFETKTNGPVSDYGSVGGFELFVEEVLPPEPLSFSFPGGLPTELTAGEPTTITVDINPGDDGPLNALTAILFYTYDASNPFFSFAPLTNTSGDTWSAEIPAGECGDEASFYISINNDAGTTFTSPEDTASPYTATVSDCGGPDCPADVNGNGVADPGDFNAWVAAFNAGAPECDQNGDGSCDPGDFNAWVINFNAGCP